MWLPPVFLLLSLPGCFSIRGPGSVRGAEGTSLALQCSYSPRWGLHGKLWCRGARWDTCQVVVQTLGGSELHAQGQRVAISDKPWANTFTVTMWQLRPDDTDTYWCGLRKAGSNQSAQVTVTVDPVAAYTPKHSRRLRSAATDTPRAATLVLSTRTHYLLLGFLKVPILLLLLGAILWLKGYLGAQSEDPLYMNVSLER